MSAVKLYDAQPAPNPRRVRIFLAEKGIDMATDAVAADAVQLVPVDMSKGEHRDATALGRNPTGQIPVLELADGTCIAESVAICRYFEALQPEPALFGTDAADQATVEMWNRRIELGLLAPVGIAWRNGPIVAKIAPGRFRQIPEAKEDAERAARAFYERLDGWIGERPFIAGARISVADITALCTIDFATRLVDLEPDAALANLWRWHAAMTARPSASA
ncbi:MAG TPA: glutathione S-transferase N-terminal domain-containing protein [Pseudomonadales bacterium]|nr:glutathione S-transferase N-terminal domain-containing protein [Pseudomonadales bacterium]